MKRRVDPPVLGSLLGAVLAGVVLSIGLGLTGCGDDDHPIVPEGSGCLDCHGDQARLQATADPGEEPSDEDPGEG